MNLEFTPEEQAFRDEVRAFIAENYPKHLGDVGLREDLSREDFLAWHKILGEKGWSVPAWPVEYGGTGWTPTQRYIWSEENARVNAVMPLPFAVLRRRRWPDPWSDGASAGRARFQTHG